MNRLGVKQIRGQVRSWLFNVKSGGNDLIHSFGDVHLYLNHLEQAAMQLERKPFTGPRMKMNPDVKDLFSFKYEDFQLEDYLSHPAIKAQIAV